MADTYERQLTQFRRIVELGFGKETDIEVVKTHTSKSHELPIVSAKRNDSDVQVTRLADNFYFNFLGIHLMHPVPATLLYPISGAFGGYALSGHVDTEEAPSVVNFEKDYHNMKPMEKFGMGIWKRDIATALVIRYLDAMTRVNATTILHAACEYEDGKPSYIGGYDDIGTIVEELDLYAKKKGYDYEIMDETGIFKKIIWNTYDPENKIENFIDIKLNEDEPLPILTVPYNDVMVPTTEAMKEGGLAAWVPANLMGYQKDGEHVRERMEMCRSGMVADQYHRTKWGTREFRIQTPNWFDAFLTGFYLAKVVAPTIQHARKRDSLFAEWEQL